jgi:hypothetical protein
VKINFALNVSDISKDFQVQKVEESIQSALRRNFDNEEKISPTNQSGKFSVNFEVNFEGCGTGFGGDKEFWETLGLSGGRLVESFGMFGDFVWITQNRDEIT